MTHFTPAPRSRRARTAGAATLLAALALAVIPWRLSAQPSSPQAPARSDGVPSGAGPADVAPGQPKPAALPGAGGGSLTGLPDSPPFEIMQFAGVVTAPTLSLGLAAGGVASEVPVNEGDAVKAGQLIAQIDDTAARAGLLEAEAGYQLKQAQLKRQAELHRQKNISDADIQLAEAEVQIAQARLSAAKHALQATRVVAPCDGVVSELNIRPGELAGNGGVLAKLIQINKLSLAFEIPPQWLAKVKVGQQVKVSVDSMPDGAFDATIESISPVVHSGSGTVAVRARLADTKGLVLPGMTGRVSFGGAK